MADFADLLDPNAPMHYQLYVQLRMEILDGLWQNRDDFPGEEELAVQSKVSVITSRQALARLAADSLIRRERGRRPVVSYDATQAPKVKSPSTIFPIAARPFQYTTLTLGVVPVPSAACRALGVRVGTPLWQCQRLRKFNRRPHSVSMNVQLPSLGERHSRKDLASLSMRDILEQIGRPISRLERQVSVRLPSALAARHLGISLLQSVLVYTYAVSDRSGQMLEWVRIYLHPKEETPVESMNLTNRTWETLDVI